jgi:ribosomal protein L11 methyltransferase
MTWLQFRLETRAELVPSCEAALETLGAAAVILEDNADEPLFAQASDPGQLWKRTRVTGLFPASADVETLWASLPETLRDQCRYLAEILEDKDWEREWMAHYRPRQFGDGLWLCPSWETPPDPSATNIMLDPGLAFGTGTHPTTAMCLERLASMAVAGRRVIDFGCGSGVLAIAALLLGAASAIAVDIEPQALDATRANALRNAVAGERLSACFPEQLNGSERADLVIANILAGPLGELADQLCAMLDPGTEATLLLSGVLVEQVPELQQCYPQPLEIIREREGWALLEGRSQ